MSESSRVQYCSCAGFREVCKIKFRDEYDNVVHRFRIEGDFSIEELRDIFIWAEKEMKS